MQIKSSASSFSQTSIILALSAVALMSGCASAPPAGTMAKPAFSQAALADAVKVPEGHRVMLETVGIGEITYECKAKAPVPTNTGAAAGFEWIFVGPQAKLTDRAGKTIGKYFGPPATWESADGSKVTGAQVAISPAPAGNIPLQLVKANPAQGTGQMVGVSYIQRVATRGGVAPSSPCDAARVGQKSVVNYQSDYIFWAAASK
jgi:Protein of unknown function (DUF3455)